MAAEAELHIVTLRHLPVSAQHSLKNRETHAHRVMLAHRPVVPATAKCAVVVKTRVATGRLRVAPIVSHATVQPGLQLVRLVTAIHVRHAMTVVRVVSLVHATTVQLVRLVTAIRAHHVMIVVLVVSLVHATTVRLAKTVAHAATSATAHLAEILVQTARHVRLVPSVMAVAQTA
jgi:hypothetical protein